MTKVIKRNALSAITCHGGVASGDGTVACLARHTPRGGHGRTRYRNDVLRCVASTLHSTRLIPACPHVPISMPHSLSFSSPLILFPHAPQDSVHPSLDSLGQEPRPVIYPEDYYSGGAYVSLPFGNVRLHSRPYVAARSVTPLRHLCVPDRSHSRLIYPSLIWKDVAPALASRGYRVLLYGAHARLALLMQHVKWPRAYVAGVSMGGGILAAFTSFFPDLVDSRVALIAPTGLVKSKDLSKITKFMSSPFVQSVTSSAPFRVR
ncbi:hypothetical protein BJV74DRAFT_867169 [Russula compacta]|nr:hypothetical protein BJV74DRAFT_867169 [Russula compacta]